VPNQEKGTYKVCVPIVESSPNISIKTLIYKFCSITNEIEETCISCMNKAIHTVSKPITL